MCVCGCSSSSSPAPADKVRARVRQSSSFVRRRSVGRSFCSHARCWLADWNRVVVVGVTAFAYAAAAPKETVSRMHGHAQKYETRNARNTREMQI